MTSDAMPQGIPPDPWTDLRAHTQARLALGRAGAALPTAELLRFGLAHAQARDAVHVPLDAEALASQLQALGCTTRAGAQRRAGPRHLPAAPRPGPPPVRCRCAGAARTGHQQTAATPSTCCWWWPTACRPWPWRGRRHLLIDAIRQQKPAGWQLGPVVIAQQARVALGDEVGALLGARLVAVLIGERPGLSSPDSLGIYLTWHPQVGRNDAQRNCISNVRPEGLPPAAAAARLWWLCQEARQLRLSGVGLKDRSDAVTLAAGAEGTPAVPYVGMDRENTIENGL